MKDTYGYQKLSYELYDLFTSPAPDFEKAEDLIRRGADVNDQGDDKEENILSDILYDFYPPEDENDQYEEFGNNLVKLIQFFLNHGYDVTRQDGLYGAQCLNALPLKAYNKYLLDAMKLILHAYGDNIPVWDYSEGSPVDAMESERGYQYAESNYYLENILEAGCQIYNAIEAGHPFDGIQTFESAIGKKVLRILARTDKTDNIFHTVDRLESYHHNCFNCDLYFIFEKSHLVYYRYINCWVDTYLPDKSLTDVSNLFPDIIGHTIQDISFGGNSVRKMRSTNMLPFTSYHQPIISIHFDNTVKINFTSNHGEVPDGETSTYYYYGDNENAHRKQNFDATYTKLNSNGSFELLHKLELSRFCSKENVCKFILPLVLRNGHFIKGYYGYYIWAGLNEMEFNLHIVHHDDQYNISGFTSTISGRKVWDLEVLSEEEWSPETTPMSRLVKFTSTETHNGQIFINIINSDAIPDYSPKTICTMQVVGIADSIDYYKSIDDYNRITTSKENLLLYNLNTITGISPTENTVFGVIKKIDEISVYMGSNLNPAIRLSIEIDTQFGSLQIVHSKNLIKTGQEINVKEGAIIKANCVILGDVAINKYQKGAIFDEEHYIKLLRYCIERNNYIRISHIIAPNCKYYYNNQKVTDYNQIDDFINNIWPNSPNQNKPISIIDKESKPYILLSWDTNTKRSVKIYVKLNDDEKISELRLTEET